MPVRDTGLSEMMADLAQEADASGVYVIEHENTSDAAALLQAKEGYFVYNDQIIADTHTGALRRLAGFPGPLSRSEVIREAKRDAEQVVREHRAYAGGVKPPLRQGSPSRPIRAGAWADRRGVTADAYEAFVEGERVDTSSIHPLGQDLR